MTVVWVIVLFVAVAAAHWGAEHLSAPLKKLRKQWGISVAAGGALVGLATASPELGINISSALRGVSEIGLGAMLGANIIALPMLVLVAYVATRTSKMPDDHDNHRAHLDKHLLPVDSTAVGVQVLPYLGILVLFALLTMPSSWRGLQPIDGWIMLAAYGIYLAQALLRNRASGQDVEWTRKEFLMAVAGVFVLAIGAFFTVMSTQNIATAIGISKVVGGLFITAPFAALPEIFATWKISRSGQVTSAVTSVIGDYAVTMTIAVFPLAMIGLEIKDFRLYCINLAFLILLPAMYGWFIFRSEDESGISRRQVGALAVVYVLYVCIAAAYLVYSGGSVRN